MIRVLGPPRGSGNQDLKRISKERGIFCACGGLSGTLPGILPGPFRELFGKLFKVFFAVFGDIPGRPSGTLWEALGVSLGCSWERSGEPRLALFSMGIHQKGATIKNTKTKKYTQSDKKSDLRKQAKISKKSEKSRQVVKMLSKTPG